MAKQKLQQPSRAERRRSQAVPQTGRWPEVKVWLLVIFGCAFCLRLFYLLQIQSIPLFYYLAGDGRTYDEWGQRIASGDWLGQGVFYQAPLYPYFLAVLQVILGHNLWFIRVVQVALGSISCGLIYLIGRDLFGQRTGVACGLLAATYAPAIFFEALIEKSILDWFLLSLLLWLLCRTKEQPHWGYWTATGATLGLLGLSRENALILGVVVPLWIALYFSGELVRIRGLWIGLFLAGLLVVLVPVGLRNLVVGGEFTLTTSQFGPNFFIGNNPSANGIYGSVGKLIGEPQLEGNDAKRLAERSLGRTLTPREISDYWFDQSWSYIKSRPTEWLKLLAKKWLLVWNAREVEDSDDFYIYQQWSWLLSLLGWINHFGVLAPLAAVGLWCSRNRWRELWLFYAMALALAVSMTLFYVFGRYRFPLVPLLTLFAGVAITEVANLYKQRAWTALLIATAVLVSALAIVNWPILNINGPGAPGYNNLANAFYEQGRVDEAIATARKAIELDPDFGVAHYNLGNLYASIGRLDQAQHHFEKALEIYPNYAEARNNLGQLLTRRGDLDGGIQQFRKAIDLKQSLSGAYLNLGTALATKGSLEESARWLEQGVRMVPTSPEAHYVLGSVYAAQGRYPEAVKSFNEVLRLQPAFVAAHQRLAEVLDLQGKKEEALQHYREAVGR